VQVDPIKPTLKAPGTKRLKLKRDGPLSSFGFKFNLSPYIPEPDFNLNRIVEHSVVRGKDTVTYVQLAPEMGRGLHSFPFCSA